MRELLLSTSERRRVALGTELVVVCVDARSVALGTLRDIPRAHAARELGRAAAEDAAST